MVQHLLFLCLLFLSPVVRSQPRDSTQQAELNFYREASRHSSFGYAAIADSCSTAGDSTGASAALLHVNPYIFMYSGITSRNIDSFLADTYLLTAAARKKYATLFRKTYDKPRSETYHLLQQMEAEDKSMRLINLSDMDSIACEEYEHMMYAADSVHYSWLHTYVTANGWPGLEDGSLFALAIAAHHTKHREFYKFHLKKAILKGDIDDGALRIFSDWQTNFFMVRPEVMMQLFNYAAFDVSEMLRDSLPKTLQDMIRFTQRHGTIGRRLVFYSAKESEMEAYWNPKIKAWMMFGDRGITGLLFDTLREYNTRSPYYQSREIGRGLSHISWIRSEKDTTRMIMYLFFGDRKSTLYKPVSVAPFRNNKFVTHAINFAVNSATILPGSDRDIIRVVDWLKEHADARLEIGGHTDSDGDEATNRTLSAARAEAVKKYMEAMGIAASRLIARGYGETQPVSSNSTAKGKAANRRVEFVKQ